MKIKELTTYLSTEIYNNNPIILSDSGWECDPTDINGIYYSKKANVLIFTQGYDYHFDDFTLDVIQDDINNYNLRFHVDDFQCIK